jgi:radical SAM superfamily enzyme YgiQ (UPF0313 family)
MKILICQPFDKRLSIVVPNLGLSYLSASLKRRGHEVRVLDCVKENVTFDGFRALLKKGRYDFVGIQILSCDYPVSKRMFRIVKEINKDIVTVAGGPHISGLPEFSLIDCPKIDYGLTAEADIAITRFCEYISGVLGREYVPNLVYRADDDVICNRRENPENLDEIGFPDWHSIDPRDYPPSPHGMFTKSLPTAPIITSRGCPYECTYAMRDITQDESFAPDRWRTSLPKSNISMRGSG